MEETTGPFREQHFSLAQIKEIGIPLGGEDSSNERFGRGIMLHA
jgi:hypothetical protein